jgi:hypothetical protein
MAHFAEIDGNNIVVRVLKVPDDQEHRGQDYLANDLGLGGTWIQTSYNTRGGVHYNPNSDVPSGKTDKGRGRKNFASVGQTYDPVRDLFVAPKPFPSWILDEATGRWDSPVPRPSLPPEAPFMWAWDEETGAWIKVLDPDLGASTQ